MNQPELQDLIEQAKEHQAKYPPTAADKREHAISFAYGNLVLDVPDTKREDVARAWDEMHGVK